MAGLRERQKREREERILRAATRLFDTRGYAETGVEDIAAEAGLAVGTIYNYFGSKPELLVTMIRGETSETLAEIEPILKDAQLPPREAISRVFDVYVGLLGRHPREHLRQLVVAALANPAAIAGPIFGEDLRLVSGLADLLAELRARGALADDADPGQVAVVLYGVYAAWFLAYLASRELSLDEVRRQIRAGVDIVMRGVTP